MSILDIIRGDVDPTDIHKSLQRIREKKIVNFIPWGPASIQVALSKQSPYLKNKIPYKVSGCMMANHSNIATLFQRIMRSYNMLRKRNAFLNQYRETSIFEKNLDEFDDAAESITNLIEEYKAIQGNDYINWGLKQHQKKMQQSQQQGQAGMGKTGMALDSSKDDIRMKGNRNNGGGNSSMGNMKDMIHKNSKTGSSQFSSFKY